MGLFSRDKKKDLPKSIKDEIILLKERASFLEAQVKIKAQNKRKDELATLLKELQMTRAKLKTLQDMEDAQNKASDILTISSHQKAFNKDMKKQKKKIEEVQVVKNKYLNTKDQIDIVADEFFADTNADLDKNAGMTVEEMLASANIEVDVTEKVSTKAVSAKLDNIQVVSEPEPLKKPTIDVNEAADLIIQ